MRNDTETDGEAAGKRVIALSFVLAGAVKYVSSDLPPLCSVASDAVGCLNAIADPQAMQVMLSALFAYVLHASQKKLAAA